MKLDTYNCQNVNKVREMFIESVETISFEMIYLWNQRGKPLSKYNADWKAVQIFVVVTSSRENLKNQIRQKLRMRTSNQQAKGGI